MKFLDRFYDILPGKTGQIIVPKLKFALASLTGTVIDYSLYLVLVTWFLLPVPSNIISSTCGMVVNFFMQKLFVFALKRKVQHAFLISLAISLVGIGIGTGIIYLLTQITFFTQYQFITKLMASGVVFFFNFYLKRFAFEKRFFGEEHHRTHIDSK